MHVPGLTLLIGLPGGAPPSGESVGCPLVGSGSRHLGEMFRCLLGTTLSASLKTHSVVRFPLHHRVEPVQDQTFELTRRKPSVRK